MRTSHPILFAAAVLVGSCGPSAAPTEAPAAHQQVRRTVEIELVALEGPEARGATRIEGAARVRPGLDRGGDAPILDIGSCSPVMEPPGGVRPVAQLGLAFGEELPLEWSRDAGRYVGVAPGLGLDLAWRPVSVWTRGADWWSLEMGEALQFGDALVVEHVEELPGGGRRVTWQGDYAPEDVELRIRTAGGEVRCSVGEGTAELPWWAARLPEADIYLAATRTERRLLQDGTLVTGRATIAVPLVVRGARAEAVTPEAVEDAPAARQPSRMGVDRTYWRRVGRSFRTTAAG